MTSQRANIRNCKSKHTSLISVKFTGRVETLLLKNVGTQEEEEKKKRAWIIGGVGVTERQSHCSPFGLTKVFSHNWTFGTAARMLHCSIEQDCDQIAVES